MPGGGGLRLGQDSKESHRKLQSTEVVRIFLNEDAITRLVGDDPLVKLPTAATLAKPTVAHTTHRARSPEVTRAASTVTSNLPPRQRPRLAS
jgi:hypothetical protein